MMLLKTCIIELSQNTTIKKEEKKKTANCLENSSCRKYVNFS